MSDGDRYDQGCQDTRAVLMPEIERLRRALYDIINLDHHNHGPKRKSTEIAQDALTAAQ